MLADDHVEHPRGELAYHIELVTLLARCVEGVPTTPVLQLRPILPITPLIGHLLQDHLPIPLRRAYLALFDGLYLEGIDASSCIGVIVEQAGVPVVVDAGLRCPSDAALAMELGADAVLANSAVARADDAPAMARAFKLATEAGRLAYTARPMAISKTAVASSPLLDISK